MKFRDLNIILNDNGWYHHHTNGSHYIYRNQNIKGSIPVPNHKGDILKGTLNNILKSAGINLVGGKK